MADAGGRQYVHHLVPTPGQPGPFPHQFIVPELHLVGPGPAIAPQPQQAVALLQHPLVTLQPLQVQRVGLRDENVEEAASRRGRPLHQPDVLHAEQHGVNQTHQRRGGAAHPVNPDLLVDTVARPACSI